jgi:dipeptidyl aminopeptidase/acylaminoacyl peptidase
VSRRWLLLGLLLLSACRPPAVPAVPGAAALKPPPLPKPGRIGRDVLTYNVLVPHVEGKTRVWIYLPRKRPKGKKLPLVLIAPAGTRGFHGMALGDGDVAEHVPYARAGFVVAAYEIWGPLVDEPTDPQAFAAARAYLASDAGLVNARAALTYALKRVPSIDPKRIYAAGHSSSATAALSLAEREPRIKGCIAYAPAVDVVAWLGDTLGFIDQNVPGFQEMIRRSSPSQNAASLRCPVFLFHANDDTNVPVHETAAYAGQLRRHNPRVELVTVPSGGHYDSMIHQGIPRAIRWLKRL